MQQWPRLVRAQVHMFHQLTVRVGVSVHNILRKQSYGEILIIYIGPARGEVLGGDRTGGGEN